MAENKLNFINNEIRFIHKPEGGVDTACASIISTGTDTSDSTLEIYANHVKIPGQTTIHETFQVINQSETDIFTDGTASMVAGGLYAVNASIDDLTSTTGVITNLTGTTAAIDNVSATTGAITNLTGTTATITNVSATNGEVATLTSTTGVITNLTGTTATITNVSATNGEVATLTSTTAAIDNVSATTGTITNLTGSTATITNIDATNATITSFTGTHATITNIAGSDAVITNITTSGTFSTSDRKLKKNILNISNPLNKINNVNGVSFTWKSNNENTYGCIAQEIQAVLPYAIKDTGTKLVVNYNCIIGLLIESVKELDIKCNNLKNEINELKK